MIIISTSEEDSACYVETKNLDGETNLKIKRGIVELRSVRLPADCGEVRCHIDCEPPNSNLYSFSGTMVIRPPPGTQDNRANRKTVPMSANNMLLRGCVLRNTQWAIGLVAYTGADTKIMLNSGETPSKRSRIDRQINPQAGRSIAALLELISFLIALFGRPIDKSSHSMHSVCALTAAIYAGSFLFETAPFIGISQGTIESPFNIGILTFFRCMIIFQNLIPIALYISLDVTKTFQSYMIHLDEDMYDPETGKHVQPQAWNLCDDLGQIEYIFSDKTGTLTSNTMEFRKASINGIMYGHIGVSPTASTNLVDDETNHDSGMSADRLKAEAAAMHKGMLKLFHAKYISANPCFIDAKIPLHLSESSMQARKLREFFSLLAICHTVLIEKQEKNPDEIIYKAQSPDEAALVSAAKDTGFACLRRIENLVEIDVLGVNRIYTILNVIEFNSDRKRMSVIARRPEGEIVLMCKGADSVIYERLGRDNDQDLMDITSNHLALFANQGLRTLCLSYRIVPEDEYQSWAEKYTKAQALIENREAECDAVAEMIEHDLTLMGATAIEDKLQDGVPECIATLAKAGIKIWVLTGDKMETAINIGFSCNLLQRSMVLIVIKSKSLEDSISQINEALSRFWTPAGAPIDGQEYGMIIDGESLKHALDITCRPLLLELGCRCRAVVCCRVSPLQKAMVVQLVRKGLDAMCLAIGDGANDVSMIQEADIGVGISGKEGLQAVMASDYAISQFRFLSRLLLVHGRWAYLRSSQLVLNYFYKNIVWLFILFWHQFFNGFTGSLITDFTYSMFFNTIFSLLPTLLIGSVDQDVNDRISVQVPQLYIKGIYQTLYNMQQFWTHMADGVFQSLVCYCFGLLIFMENTLSSDGRDTTDSQAMGTTIAFAAIIVTNLYAILSCSSWTFLTHIALWPTLIAWIAYIFIYASVATSPIYGIWTLFTVPGFYLSIILSVVVSLFPRIAIKFVQQYFMPNDTDIVREIQQYHWKEGQTLSLDAEYAQQTSHALKETLVDAIPSDTLATHSKDNISEQPIKRNLSDIELKRIVGAMAGKDIGQRTRSDEQLRSEQPGGGALYYGKQLVEVSVDSVGHVVAPDQSIGVSTDGFGAAAAAAVANKQDSAYPVDSTGVPRVRHRKGSVISNVIKSSVTRASQFVRRIAQPTPSNLQLARSTRASSLVYMGDNGGQIANTGFAFSQDSGMSEVISPQRFEYATVAALD
eukprot:jgi/Hompol1/3469/HPOL_003247-RA